MQTADHKEPRWEGFREVVTMSWPIMLGAVSFTLMDFVDRWFVSRLGDEDFAAIGSAGLWSYVVSVFFLGITGCVSTFAAQSLGRGNYRDCSRFAWQGIYIAIATGVFGLALLPFTPTLFGLMNHAPGVTEKEVAYFNVRILGFAFIAWQSALSSYFQAISRPKIPMLVSIVANLSNIVLDWALIFGKLGLPAMGIRGAATATVISLGVQVLLLHAIFLSAYTDRDFASRSSYRLDWIKIRDLFRIGWPAGVSSFIDVATWGILTSVIVGGGQRTLQLAAHNAAIAYMHLIFIPVMALGYGTTAIVGQWIGRGEIDIAKRRTYTATKIAAVQLVGVGTLFAVFGAQLMSFFSSNAEVIRIGHTLLIFAAVFAGFDAINIVMIGALRGAGDTKWVMWAMSAGSAVFMLPLAWIFADYFELEVVGAWIGATAYIILLALLVYRRFAGERWRHIQIFSEDRATTKSATTIESEPAAAGQDAS